MSTWPPVDVAVVGAGPQAMALALALPVPPLVIDPSGTWLTSWCQRFAAHRIDRLRSAAVHHPHPDPHVLRRHALDADRSSELHDPYDLPGSDLFEHVCRHLIDDADLASAVRRGTVTSLELVDGGALLHLEDGQHLAARRVVLAANPVRSVLPIEAILAEDPRVRHGDDIDLEVDLAGDAGRRAIDVVGGGLTAVQLAIGAAAAGTRTRLIGRRPLVERQFDVEPGWLGPRELDRWRTRPPAERRRLIDRARGGGSVPAGDLARLRSSTVVHLVDPDAAACALAGDADELWFATGHQLDAAADPLLAELRAAHPVAIHGGLPELDRDLRWPGTPVHLMGGYAALVLGPAARNLWGARQAAQRIAASIHPTTSRPPTTSIHPTTKDPLP